MSQKVIITWRVSSVDFEKLLRVLVDMERKLLGKSSHCAAALWLRWLELRVEAWDLDSILEKASVLVGIVKNRLILVVVKLIRIATL